MPPTPQTGTTDSLRLGELLTALEHDVKNPVGNILGYLALMRDDPHAALSDTQADFLGRIEHNCEIILRLVRQFVEAASDRSET